MSVPNARVLDQKIDELGHQLSEAYAAAKRLKAPYRWASAWGLQPSVIGDGGAGGGKGDIAYSDPAGDVVASEAKAATRAACVDAVRAVDDAIAAAKDLAEKILDPAHTGLTKRMPEPRVGDEKAAHEREKEIKATEGRCQAVAGRSWSDERRCSRKASRVLNLHRGGHLLVCGQHWSAAARKGLWAYGRTGGAEWFSPGSLGT
jgi:hypothetical protein